MPHLTRLFLHLCLMNMPMDRLLYFRLAILFFLQYFIWGSWYVTLGTYLLQTLDFNGREVGLVYGTMAIAATVTPFLMGRLADRLFATEKLLAFVNLGSGGILLVVAGLKSFWLIYPLLMLYFLFFVPTFALSTALAFFHVSNGQKHFPKIRVWGTIGWVVAGILISYLNLEKLADPMRISGISSILTALYCLTLPHTPPPDKNRPGSMKKFLGPEIIALLRRPAFTVMIVCLMLIAIPSGFYYTFVNAFLNEIGMANAAAKMSIGQLSEILVMLLLPFLYARVKLKWIIAAGLLIWGGRYFLFAFGNNDSAVWLLYFAIILHGFAFSFSFLTAQIYVDKVAPPQIRSTAQGFMTMVTMGIGALIGSYIAGEVVKAFTAQDGSHDWQSIWLVPAIFGCLVTIGFVLCFNPPRK